jgi:cell division protein FtsB
MQPFLTKIGLIVILALVCMYAVAALRGPNGVGALAEKRRLIRDLQEQNASLDAENKRKRERIELLKTDRPAQELEIREKLKLMRPGETQFILPETPKESPSPVGE